MQITVIIPNYYYNYYNNNYLCHVEKISTM